VGREAHVVGRRDHDVGDDPALQAPHPIGQHDLWDTTELLEALSQHRQRRLRSLVGGEAHEPPPRPGQHRAEHVQRALRPPVDHQRLSRRPHRRTAPPVMVAAPIGLRLGHEAPEVAGRTRVARRPGLGQQAFGRDLPRRLLHPGRHDIAYDVVVALRLLSRRRHLAGGQAGQRPLDRLRVTAAHRGRPPVSAHLAVGGGHVHVFPR
jgi:hypothetical protein